MRFLFMILIAGGLGGCGNAHRVEVGKDPVQTPSTTRFEKEDLLLNTNVFFLWRKDVTPQDVSEMSSLGDKFAQLKMQMDIMRTSKAPIPPELSGQAMVMQQRMMALSDRFTIVPLIQLAFSGETLNVEFSGWSGKIERSSYQPQGGVVEIKATDSNGDRYNFRLSRNRFDLVAKGLVSFFGDLKVTTASGENRVGVGRFLGPKPP